MNVKASLETLAVTAGALAVAARQVIQAMDAEATRKKRPAPVAHHVQPVKRQRSFRPDKAPGLIMGVFIDADEISISDVWKRTGIPDRGLVSVKLAELVKRGKLQRTGRGLYQRVANRP